MEEKNVEICKELAMSIWTKRYGKATRVNDFAGREMEKGAYDQRGSAFGWNLDHILPKSRGGKDTESNLVCCHIKTNDEKADKFPCFTANGKQFEILKVENHYEIREKKDETSTSTNSQSDNTNDASVNFFDPAAGLRLYRSLAKNYWGTVTIKLSNPENAAIFDFIKEIFNGETVTVKKENSYSYGFTVFVDDVSLPTVSSVQELLNKCLTLNSYLKFYFAPKKSVSGYRIFCEAHTQKDQLECISERNSFNNYSYYYSQNNGMAINEPIRYNTDAKKDIGNNEKIGTDRLEYAVYGYDYHWTKLAENLKPNNN